MKRHRTYLLAIAGVALVIALSVVDTLIGEVALDGSELAHTIFWQIRTPRILMAVLAGAMLSLSGVQMQGLFRNPLADPHIMGISGGAGLGAALATAGCLGSNMAGGLSVTAAAFVGAMTASLAVLAVSYRSRGPATLLIFGVMLGFIFSALTSIVEYSTSQESLKAFYGWSSGSFSNVALDSLPIVGTALILGLSLSLAASKGLDLILFGEGFATISGSSTSQTRILAIAGCCLMTGAVTAFCGPIGFVGIIAPHITRALLRSSQHSIVLPFSMLTGAAISLIADIASQVSPSPIPVGSTMALIGIPITICILLKK